MASIKKSELRLLIIFGILILGAVTFFVLEVLNGKKNDALARQTAVRNKIREYNELIRDKEQWEVKREFVGRYQPVFRSEELEAPALEAYFRRNAQAENVEVKTLLPQPPEPLGNDMMSISLQAKVSGLGSDILRFLILLQAENRFYAIPSITIASDRKDPTQVNVDMVFRRKFNLDGEMPSLSDPEEEPVGTFATSQPETKPEPEPAAGDPEDPGATKPAFPTRDPNPDKESETSKGAERPRIALPKTGESSPATKDPAGGADPKPAAADPEPVVSNQPEAATEEKNN